MLNRRLAMGAFVAAPLAAGAALSGRVRSALVGARGFADSWAPPGSFPKMLRGPAGDERILARPPRRIASAYLGADELLAELVTVDRVVGVSAYADDRSSSNCHDAYPAALPRLRADPEPIIALAPDLVCVASITAADSLRLLIGAGLPVLRWSRFDSFADVLDVIQVMGAAVGEEARAAAWPAGSPGCSPTSSAACRASVRCAFSTTIRRPTRWGGARCWVRSWPARGA